MNPDNYETLFNADLAQYEIFRIYRKMVTIEELINHYETNLL